MLREIRPRYALGGAFALFLLVVLLFIASLFEPAMTPPQSASSSPPSAAPQGSAASSTPQAPAHTGPRTLVYSFNVPGTLQEASSMEESSSPYWWLNSGGQLIVKDGHGETIQGDLPIFDRWRVLYALSNARDTDGGLHPQNLFRLVSKSEWENVTMEASLYIAADRFSASPNRNQSNGLLLMSRYSGDGQTLYYAGVRVDGTAVIKKKYHGTYYTLAQKQLFPGTYAMSGTGGSKDLLPHNTWISLRATTKTNADGSVSIALSLLSADNAWKQILSAKDAGGASVGATPPIRGAFFVGIRTDFMDVLFKNVKMTAI